MPTNKPTTSSHKTQPVASHQGLTTARSAFDLFGPCYEAFKLNLKSFLVLLFVPTIAITAVFAILSHAMGADATATAENGYGLSNLGSVMGAIIITVVVAAVLQFFFYAWLVSVELKSSLMQRTTITEAMEHVRGKYWRLFLGLLLVSFIIALGLILLIVPGLFMWKRYALVPYYIVDKNLSVPDAMRASVSASSGENSQLIWGVIGVTILVVVGGSIVSSILESIIPYLGTIFLTVLSGIYAIAFAIRYQQIEALQGTVPAKKSTAASPLS